MSTRAEETPTQLSAASLQVACAKCGLHDVCLPVGLNDAEVERLDALVVKRQPVERGACLFRAGDRFEALYAVRTGFFKTRTTCEDGREHVTGFQMVGELLGLDGVGTDVHTCDAVALEDAQVCVIPFEKLEDLSREFPGLQHQVHKIMGREIVRDQGVMVLLGSMRAQARVASFLLDLARRLEMRGLSSSALVLRMTRQEIGTFLGLKLETVSRCFSKLQADGLLAVRQRRIQILDPAALRALLSVHPLQAADRALHP
ncbi:helix-turn-helix domain-containing protein [Aquabacterium sp.]|uniref:helix-turn-helix domain-containing protein n=1 Tax=Aquabacterium sp. TaxID=1872578 RepID=UPI002C47FED9|nr:helix-turn-helix domain-containing protein [Aquabacterium sp.]HSW05934.1 helix-turn-helix domain-containing protein [Aquabacterium sp.]